MQINVQYSSKDVIKDLALKYPAPFAKSTRKLNYRMLFPEGIQTLTSNIHVSFNENLLT
jgi:hypothetical protein